MAEALHAPLDSVLVRKIGAQMQKELAISAVTNGDLPYVFIDRHMTAMIGVPENYIEAETARQINRAQSSAPHYGFPQARIARIAKLQLEYVTKIDELAARIVDAHGDLCSEHIYLGSPLCIIDCLEFDS